LEATPDVSLGFTVAASAPKKSGSRLSIPGALVRRLAEAMAKTIADWLMSLLLLLVIGAVTSAALVFGVEPQGP